MERRRSRTSGQGAVTAEATWTSDDEQAHAAATRDAYDILAPVWSAATDRGPFNGLLERPAFRSLVPAELDGATVVDAACGAGAGMEWLTASGARAVGFDASAAMVAECRMRCGPSAAVMVADLARPLPLGNASVDGVTCELALHYLRDWTVPLGSFARVLRAGGWVVLSLDHPAAPPVTGQSDDWFATELVADTWTKEGVTVTQRFWRHPLAVAVDAFANAGFVVERIAEPRPSEALVARHPELAAARRRPLFMVYRLRLAT